MMIRGWQQLALAAIFMLGVLAITVVYHRETILNSDIIDTLNRRLPSANMADSARQSKSTKREDMMTKWFSDLGSDVKLARNNCNLLLPANSTFTGEYLAMKPDFEAATKAATARANFRVEGFSAQVKAQNWVCVTILKILK
jgi:hypothetical protein